MAATHTHSASELPVPGAFLEGKARTVAELREIAEAARRSGDRLVARFAFLEMLAALMLNGEMVTATSLALRWDADTVFESDGGMAARVLDDLEAAGMDVTELRPRIGEDALEAA